MCNGPENAENGEYLDKQGNIITITITIKLQYDLNYSCVAIVQSSIRAVLVIRSANWFYFCLSALFFRKPGSPSSTSTAKTSIAPKLEHPSSLSFTS